jgi:hypothetical protein
MLEAVDLNAGLGGLAGNAVAPDEPDNFHWI